MNTASPSMIQRISRSIESWKAQYSVDGNSLAVYRFLFSGWMMLFGPPQYAWLGEVPKAFYSAPPLSIASFFDTFPDASFFRLLDGVIAASLIFVAVGFLTRLSTGVLLVSLLVGNSFQYSFGKIDHAILVQCVLLVMIFANWGRSLSIDQLIFQRRFRGDPSIWLLALLLAFGFFSAGFGKAINWIDFDPRWNGFLNWLYSGYYTLGRQDLLAPVAINIRPLWIWELADISAVVFELGFLVAILRHRWLMTWLAIACAFHLTNCLVLNIPFSIYAICYLAFVPWTKVFPRLVTADRFSFQSLLAILALMVLLSPPLNLLDFLDAPSWSLERAVAIWFTAGIVLLFSLWRLKATGPVSAGTPDPSAK